MRVTDGSQICMAFNAARASLAAHKFCSLSCVSVCAVCIATQHRWVLERPRRCRQLCSSTIAAHAPRAELQLACRM